MLNLRKLTGIRQCKELLLVCLGDTMKWYSHRSQTKNMVPNPFLPPSDVKGMRVLVKERFNKTITVPGFYIPMKSIGDCRKTLKKYLLKLVNFKSLTEPSSEFINKITERNVTASILEGKMAFLDSRKVQVYSDIEENDRCILEGLGMNENYMAPTVLTLTYDNYKADEILRAVLPSENDSVSGYSLVGHILHLNLRDHLNEYKKLIGSVLLDKVTPARTVVNKVDIIDNTYRSFKMELLCGDNDMIATVRENRYIYKFDYSEVYWNPRLSTEHERVVNNLGVNDVLYDVFCGVGPFAIPAAKKGCVVLANDLNPNSVKWLKCNMTLNKVKDNLQVFNKDGYDFIKEDIKRHMLLLKEENCKSITIVMNLPALAPTFLPAFQRLMTESEMCVNNLPTPKVIVYCFVKGDLDPSEMALKLVGDELGIDFNKGDEEVVDISFVRDVAPNKKMMRITLSLTNKILESKKRSNEICTIDSKRVCH